MCKRNNDYARKSLFESFSDVRSNRIRVLELISCYFTFFSLWKKKNNKRIRLFEKYQRFVISIGHSFRTYITNITNRSRFASFISVRKSIKVLRFTNNKKKKHKLPPIFVRHSSEFSAYTNSKWRRFVKFIR